MRKGQKGGLRIIGGRLRGRKLPVAEAVGLRPTPDRVRETLFNWIQAQVAGARCLDLFAGSGALGFEAASRGAAVVQLVERDPAAARCLAETVRLLDEPAVRVSRVDARAFLAGEATQFDIVFVDPPFRSGLIELSCETLETCGWLAPEAVIYLESSEPLDTLKLPQLWRLHRVRRAGEVHFGLALRRGRASP